MYLPVCLAGASKLTSLLSYCVTLLREGEITTCSSNKRRSSSPSTTIIIKREEITIQANERSPQHGKVPEKMSAVMSLSRETRELGKNRYRAKRKVKRFPIQMTTKCHSNWKTSMKYGIGKVIHTVHKPKEERDIALRTLCNKNPFNS